jgi:hypothetical protein
MSGRVGKNQLEILVALGLPTMTLLVPGPETRGMVKKGLLKESKPRGSVCITARGLRTLADEMDAGRVDDALQRMVEAVKEQLRRIQARDAATHSAKVKG